MSGSMISGFSRSQRGAIKIIFALALPALVALLAMAVELTNIHTARRALQDSLDAATLAAARSRFTTDAERTTLAQAFVEQNISHRFNGMVSGVSIVTSGADSEITQGRATITVPLSFAGIIGMNQQVVPMLSEVKSAPDGKLELALVLDTTGSMGTGGRIAALKVAAKDLVNEVMDGENVQVAVVPFAKYVNIGMANRNEPGLAIPADIPGSKSCQWLDEKGPINCKEVTEQCPITTCKNVTADCPSVVCKEVSATCYNDGAPYSCKKTQCETKGTKKCTKTECTTTGTKSCTKNECEWGKTGKKYESCKSTPPQVWEGCVGSRDYPLNTLDKDINKKIPGYLNSQSDSDEKIRCNSELQRLTTHVGAVTSVIDSLSTQGWTNIPAGAMWGWRALSHRHPFADGINAASDPKVRKAMIIMSDGENTRAMRLGGGFHDSKDTARANSYLSEICTNVKADDIDIYTVAFQITDKTIKDLMQKCATSPAMYYDTTNASALKEAFAQIAKDLKVIYISR